MTIVNIFMIYVFGREVKLVVQCLEKIKPKISTRDPARDCWLVPRGN